MLLTKGELNTISKRIDEINALFEFDQLPEDVQNNLEMELDSIIKRLKLSQLKAKMHEKGIKIIK